MNQVESKPEHGEQLQGTPACKLRDGLSAACFAQKITMRQIKERLNNIELEDWLCSDILRMVNYNQFGRCTCKFEQALADRVYFQILRDILKEEKSLNQS